jgi:cell wall-associated NlpC family hydrolase
MPASTTRQRFALPILFATLLALTTVFAGAAEANRHTGHHHHGHHHHGHHHHGSQRAHKIAHAVAVAVHQKGDPYVYGAEGPNAFDCSGLTEYSFAKAGLYLPRTSDAQYRFVRHIHKRNIRRGDLVFFHDGSGSVYHVGIFAGRRHGSEYILHAPYTGQVVHRERIWTGSWYAGTMRRR